MDAMAHDDLVRRFGAYYKNAGAAALRELELRALGTSEGGNSFTDIDGARRIGTALQLTRQSVLLDVGTGAGWPGLFLARESGCRVVLSDVTVEGLGFATVRATEDGVRASAVAGRGSHLPFRSRMFDAVTHADVLC